MRLWGWLRWPFVVVILMYCVATDLLFSTPRTLKQNSALSRQIGSIACGVRLGASDRLWYICGRNFGNFQLFYGGIARSLFLLLLLSTFLQQLIALWRRKLNAVVEHASTEGKDDAKSY